MVLTVTGRRTGRRTACRSDATTPQHCCSRLAASGGDNVRGGADVRVILDGRERRGHAVLAVERDHAAEEFAALLNRAGPRPLGVKLHVARASTTAEVKAALRGRGVAHMPLTD